MDKAMKKWTVAVSRDDILSKQQQKQQQQQQQQQQLRLVLTMITILGVSIWGSYATLLMS